MADENQTPCVSHETETARVFELEKALSDLMIEAEGFIKCHEWVIRNDHGNSNINVMNFRIEAAKKALRRESL